MAKVLAVTKTAFDQLQWICHMALFSVDVRGGHSFFSNALAISRLDYWLYSICDWFCLLVSRFNSRCRFLSPGLSLERNFGSSRRRRPPPKGESNSQNLASEPAFEASQSYFASPLIQSAAHLPLTCTPVTMGNMFIP